MASSSGQEDQRAAIKEAKRSLDEAQKSYKRRVKEARDELSRAEQSREQTLREARRKLQDSQNAYDKRVASALISLDQARTGERLGMHGEVELYDNRLESAEGVVPLSTEIKASVDSSGELTSNSDTRELYLTLDTPKYQRVISCGPGDSAKVREFAAAINTAAKNADERIHEHEVRLRAAEQEAADAKQDRAAITAAQGRVDEVERDTASVDAARDRLVQIEADTSEIDARGAEVLAIDPTAKVGPPKLPRRSPFRAVRPWWSRRSRWGKVGIIAAAVLVALILIGALLPAEGANDESASPAPPPPPTQPAEPPPMPPPPPAEPPPPPPPATPRERVREAIGDEVAAGGYAGDLEIRDVTFEGREVQVIATTPEGGLQGASCGDLNDGAQAVFTEIYRDAGWPGGAALLYQGGLVSTQTGEELPDANTGIFTMPAPLARQIDWSNDDALNFNIDWSNFRDFCHPALQ
jgi:hypothetical protein